VDGFELMKTLHVIAAVIWVGGAVTIQILAVRLQRAGTPQQLVSFARDAEWMGTHVYLPSSILVLLLGIGMVVDTYGFSQLWIILGLIGIGLSVAIGAGYLGPQSGKLATLIERKGPDDPETQAALSRIFTVSRIDLVILLLIVVDMVVKPGL
jgi:uncharacterized membrane protein